MSVAARTAERVLARRATLARVQPRTASLLAGLVACSFLLRTIIAWQRATPTFFPDEYIYAELARSISEAGQPLIRGAAASFPALLQPILTAPAWLVGDVETSFRLVQTLGALVMSLAVVPVFLLARHLGIRTPLALLLGALTILVPDMVYSTWVVAEPFAYPLVLGAVAAGVAALTRPRPRLQLAFLALAGLAMFARVQFAVLPFCFLAAAVLVGLRERRLRAALREQLLVVGLLLVPALGIFAVGPARALGFYRGVLDIDFLSLAYVKWVGLDAMFLVYASGVVLAPGALIGLWLALRHPRSRTELSFGALSLMVIGVLLLEAGGYGLEGRLQERYFFYAVPLVGIAFVLYASRGWPHRLVHGVLAAGLVVLALRVPLSGYSVADLKTGSPILFATTRLERALNDVSLASLVFVVGVTVLLGCLVLLSRRPAIATPAVLGLALATCATMYGAAVSFNLGNAEIARDQVLGPQASFVDSSGIQDVAMLQTRSSDRGIASEYLFWNRTVDDVYLLPFAAPPDAFATTSLAFGEDGTLLADGKAVERPLMVDGFSDTVRFRASTEVATSPAYRVVESSGPHQLALYAPGRAENGWLGLFGVVRIWPENASQGLAGTLSFRLTAPEGAEGRIMFTPEDGQPEELLVAPGSSRNVSFAVCTDGPWRVNFEAPSTGTVGGRYVSMMSSEPAYRPDPAACR